MTDFPHRVGRRGPLLRGAALALFAAVAFGVTTPLIQRFGRGAGSAPTAALLYGALRSLRCNSAPRGRAHWRRT